MEALLSSFSGFFQLKKRNVFSHFINVLAGLQIASNGKGNIENIANLVGVKYDALHHFMSDSPWNAQEVIAEVARLTYGLMRKHKEPIVLAIDETSFVKKGKNSAGVGHQYLGTVGKTANGQVVVMSSLVQGTNAALVAADIYLHKKFHRCKESMNKVGLDPALRPYRSKIDLALDQIDQLVNQGCIPDYVVADAFYGISIDFREYCRHLKIKYVLDIKENLHVWFPGTDTENDKSKAPASDWEKYLKHGHQKVVKVQSNKAKRPIVRNVTLIPVTTYDSKTCKRIPQTLMVIDEANVGLSFKLTDEPCQEDKIDLLTKIAAHRYYIERTFQNAKQLFNIDGYQVRKYDALIKHLAMAMVLGYKYNFQLYATEQEEPYMSQNKLLELFRVFLKAICAPKISLEEALQALAAAQERALKNLALAEEYWAEVKVPK